MVLANMVFIEVRWYIDLPKVVIIEVFWYIDST